MFCFFCGKDNPDSNEFCMFCGKKLHAKTNCNEDIKTTTTILKDKKECSPCGTNQPKAAVDYADRETKKESMVTVSKSASCVSKALQAAIIVLSLCIIGIVITIFVVYSNRKKINMDDATDNTAEVSFQKSDVNAPDNNDVSGELSPVYTQVSESQDQIPSKETNISEIKETKKRNKAAIYDEFPQIIDLDYDTSKKLEYYEKYKKYEEEKLLVLRTLNEQEGISDGFISVETITEESIENGILAGDLVIDNLEKIDHYYVWDNNGDFVYEAIFLDGEVYYEKVFND